MKISSMHNYLNKAQNGARVLFDLNQFRLVDGMRKEKQSYFLIVYLLHETKYFELNISEAYEYLTWYLKGHQEALEDALEEAYINTKTYGGY